jgi:hypothetical protein
MKKKRNNDICSLGEKIVPNRISYSKDSTKVYKYKMPNNKKKEPNKVYKKK